MQSFSSAKQDIVDTEDGGLPDIITPLQKL